MTESSAGVLASVESASGSSLQVHGPSEVFYPRGIVEVISGDRATRRGSFVVKSTDGRTVFSDGPLPIGTAAGDLLILPDWRQ